MADPNMHVHANATVRGGGGKSSREVEIMAFEPGGHTPAWRQSLTIPQAKKMAQDIVAAISHFAQGDV